MRCPFAEWRGTVPNMTPGGFERPAVGVVFHIMGASMQAADNWFHNSNAKASAHFGIGLDGRLVQWVDTDDRAWHAVAANRHWYGVETEGQGGALSDAGVATFAKLYRWLHDTEGVPYKITDDPNNGHGLGYHQMGGQAWGGHACPGPARVAQRQKVLDLAQGATPQPQEDIDMKLIGDGKNVFVLGPAGKRHIASGEELDAYKAIVGNVVELSPKAVAAVPDAR